MRTDRFQLTAIVQDPATSSRFHATAVTRVIRQLGGGSPRETKARWLQAVASHVVALRPDLAGEFLDVLGVEPLPTDPLEGRSIGEIAVCYEALLASIDAGARRASGQFFTPDDAARFMAERSAEFPRGIWLDPCCGIGNLSWHLAGAQQDPAEFVRAQLVLADIDECALRSAVVLIAAEYLRSGDKSGFEAFRTRAAKRDFLSSTPRPEHDFVIVNPPYARDRVRNGFNTSAAREIFAYFLERISKESKGFIAVTPASYLSAPKFDTLRKVLNRNVSGGEVFVFDNVPDTLFRGYKFGSANTSKTNFVRAAITVCSPELSEWRITPILRWRAASRARMFEACLKLLSERRLGPHGEWAKIAPGLESAWRTLDAAPEALSDLTVSDQTEYHLTVALTPRYYISAAFRDLNRGSKATLYFENRLARDRAAIVLNSSVPYIWWRAFDGGVTLPRRILNSIPIPKTAVPDKTLIERLQETEEDSVVVKLNAGSENENVKRPRELVAALNALLFPDTTLDLALVYADDMFPACSLEPRG